MGISLSGALIMLGCALLGKKELVMKQPEFAGLLKQLEAYRLAISYGLCLSALVGLIRLLMTSMLVGDPPILWLIEAFQVLFQLQLGVVLFFAAKTHQAPLEWARIAPHLCWGFAESLSPQIDEELTETDASEEVSLALISAGDETDAAGLSPVLFWGGLLIGLSQLIKPWI